MKKAASPGRAFRFEEIPNVGPRVARDFRFLGMTFPRDLKGRDPYRLYEELCRKTGVRHDPCLLDTFIAAVNFMEGARAQPWWAFTSRRKRSRRWKSSPFFQER